MMRPSLLLLVSWAILTQFGSVQSARELPGGQISSHKTLDVYTALRDPLTGDVRLFMEYYLKHPLHMTPKEREGPFPAFSDVFAGCLFSDHRNFSGAVEVPAKEAHNSAPPGNGWLDCAPERGYAYVRVLLASGQVHGQTLRVENIRTERIGAVAACVAPLFSHRPDIHAWMYHMVQLGVGRFHMYLPAIHAHERDTYEAPHEVWMTVKDFNYREGETHTEPFHAFEHPLAVWHHYSPSNREAYFGQVIMYNDCVMRTRHTHDYAVLFDVDEFLYVNASAGGRGGLVQLPDYLAAAFPPKVAALEFVTWHYPENCPVTSVGTFFHRHKLRDPVHITGKNGKIIVRPKYVDEVYVHFPVVWAAGWEQKALIEPDKAFVKHIVWMQPKNVHCTNYVHEDTGIAPRPD